MRTLPALAALTLALGLAVAPARAQDVSLPDIGSSAGEMIDPAMEAEYASYVLYELRRMGMVLDDPLIDAWQQDMGFRLAASSTTPRHPFIFFMLRDRDINAFATLGGLVGMNTGLVLTAGSEAEVAGVLAHEVAHVSQRHVLRAVERAKKDQVPILLAMLGAIAVAQTSTDGRANGRREDSAHNATAAAIAGAMALMQQRQIDYTRANESEADRIGIQTLARAGYDPTGMADFFERMHRATRSNSGGYELPEYLRTHPVTTTRISEARQRAGQLAETRIPSASVARAPANPLLPGHLQLGGDTGLAPSSREFTWVRDRLRVLSAASPAAALREYREMASGPHRNDEPEAGERYGMALALMLAGQPRQAAERLDALLADHPGDLWLELARAEAAALAGPPADADRRFDALLRSHPENRAVRLSYAKALTDRATADAGRKALDVLRPLTTDGARDLTFQRGYARASELAGDLVRAGEAHAEAAYLAGRAVDALNHLVALKDREDLSYYQRARIEARIAAITPVVLEMQRQGIDAHEQRPDGH